MATPVEPQGWPRPKGYSNGMRGRGQLVAVAGQIGWDTQGKLADGFVAQLRQALSNVVTVVRAAGGDATDILSLTMYVTSKRDYLGALDAVGKAYREIMGRHYPAMALVEVSALVEDDALVEIQALAAMEGAE